jgi:hypothetical protein
VPTASYSYSAGALAATRRVNCKLQADHDHACMLDCNCMLALTEIE